MRRNAPSNVILNIADLRSTMNEAAVEEGEEEEQRGEHVTEAQSLNSAMYGSAALKLQAAVPERNAGLKQQTGQMQSSQSPENVDLLLQSHAAAATADAPDQQITQSSSHVQGSPFAHEHLQQTTPHADPPSFNSKRLDDHSNQAAASMQREGLCDSSTQADALLEQSVPQVAGAVLSDGSSLESARQTRPQAGHTPDARPGGAVEAQPLVARLRQSQSAHDYTSSPAEHVQASAAVEAQGSMAGKQQPWGDSLQQRWSAVRTSRPRVQLASVRFTEDPDLQEQ